MDTSKVLSLVEQLDDEVDDLEEALEPLLKTALSETSSKLPLLDKAKLYVLVTYAIESILFSYLRLNGVKAREHPVFIELTRVKQYFDKVKVAENPVGKRQNLSLDKGAAARIIKAGLAGNEKWDLERLEQQAKERAKAHIKFTELSEKIKQEEISKKRKAEDVDADSNSDSDSDPEPIEEMVTPTSKVSKKKRIPSPTLDSAQSTGVSSGTENPNSKKKKKEKKSKKGKKDKKIKTAKVSD